MESMLVGVDGSEDAGVALRWAAACSEAMQVPLRAVWAWQYPADTVVRPGRLELADPEQVDAEMASQLEQLLGDVLGARANRVAIEVERGPGTSALLRAASKTPGMIVVGSRGLGGFRGLLLGSVSRQLMEHASVPVTVVPSSTQTDPVALQRLAVGVDGSDHAANAVLHSADIAHRLDAEVIVVNAPEPSGAARPPGIDPAHDPEVRRANVEQWCAPLRDAGVTYTVSLAEGDPRTALLSIADAGKADLLVVGTRGLGTFGRLVLGSVASSVAQHSPVPVTVVPRPTPSAAS